jgi:hypothetical protein
MAKSVSRGDKHENSSRSFSRSLTVAVFRGQEAFTHKTTGTLLSLILLQYTTAASCFIFFLMESSGLYRRLGVQSPFDSQLSLVTSPVFSSTVLALIRLSFALYTLFATIFVLVWEAVRTHEAHSFFSYFTHLTYIGICAYFWASGVQTWLFARNGKRYPLQEWPCLLQFLHILLYSTITSFPFIVTVVFWSLLASPATFSTGFSVWSNISMHAMNSLFALFEILFTSAGPMPWSHLPFLVLIMVGYLGVAYITHATQGFYAYSFLDPEKQHAMLAAYIAGIPIGECLVFTGVRYICIFREHFAARNGQRSCTPEAIDEWQEIERAKTPLEV